MMIKVLSVPENTTSKSSDTFAPAMWTGPKGNNVRLRAVLPARGKQVYVMSYLVAGAKPVTSYIQVPVQEPKSQATLPSYMTEEQLEAFLIENGIFDKLVSQLKQTPSSQNWEDELDEL